MSVSYQDSRPVDQDLAYQELADGDSADEDLTDPEFTEELSDEELTALALSADPSAPLADDAVPLDLGRPGALALLPTWYMAPVTRHLPKRRYRIAVAAVVAAFVTIDLFGLCSTYGPLVLA